MTTERESSSLTVERRQVCRHDMCLMIGELLAAAADILCGKRLGRLSLRRTRLALVSVLQFLAVLFIILLVRCATSKARLRPLRLSRDAEHLLCHPPQSWAAP